MEDDTIIRNSMDTRRAKLLAQQRADELKIQLCDKLQKEKRSIPGLADKVANLEYTEPDLFAYIRRLEFVQDGIWCPKCETVKQTSGRPAKTTSISTDGHINDLLLEKLNTLVRSLEEIKEAREILDCNIARLEGDIDKVRREHSKPAAEPAIQDIEFDLEDTGPDFSTFNCIPDEVISSDDLLSI